MAAKNTSNSKTQARRGKLRWKKNAWDEKTGFSVGTESNLIAHAILQGGSREEIMERVNRIVPQETKTGRKKNLSSSVSRITKILRERGKLDQV